MWLVLLVQFKMDEAMMPPAKKKNTELFGFFLKILAIQKYILPLKGHLEKRKMKNILLKLQVSQVS